ncbi:MAG: hypothetical protein IBX41_07790 [Methanophagales archaeon]|nr:hypothetical protein [Methanophagales archaeon]
MPICMSVCVAEESPKFVEVKKPVHIGYDGIDGIEMVRNGSKVSIEVVLANFSKVVEGNKSELFFHSDLGVLPSIIVDEIPKEYKTPFIVDHRTVEEVKVTLSGDAPEVNKRKENVTLLNITQKIKGEEYSVIDIKRTVSSELIEDALDAIWKAGAEIEKATLAIANATGVDVSGAKTSLTLANEHLNNSQRYYNEGRPAEALEEAGRALNSAKEAEGKARAAVGGKTRGTVTIIAAVVVIAIVALLLVIQKRRRKRGIF